MIPPKGLLANPKGDRVGGRKPYQNINFVIAHDGFTLYDLVSYNQKRNGDNGEQNKDGSNDNVSWNCGFEGETDDANVLQLRRQQMRNLMVALLVSQGTPMVLSGALPCGLRRSQKICASCGVRT